MSNIEMPSFRGKAWFLWEDTLRLVACTFDPSNLLVQDMDELDVLRSIFKIKDRYFYHAADFSNFGPDSLGKVPAMEVEPRLAAILARSIHQKIPTCLKKYLPLELDDILTMQSMHGKIDAKFFYFPVEKRPSEIENFEFPPFGAAWIIRNEKRVDSFELTKSEIVCMIKLSNLRWPFIRYTSIETQNLVALRLLPNGFFVVHQKYVSTHSHSSSDFESVFGSKIRNDYSKNNSASDGDWDFESIYLGDKIRAYQWLQEHGQEIPEKYFQEILEDPKNIQTSDSSSESFHNLELLSEGSAELSENSDASVSSKKKKTSKGDAKELLVAAFSKHHNYADPGNLKTESIRCSQLAKLAGVAKSSASLFIKKTFGSAKNYYRICRTNHDLLRVGLRLMNGDIKNPDEFPLQEYREAKSRE